MEWQRGGMLITSGDVIAFLTKRERQSHELIKKVKRKRSWRPSEIAMTLAGLEKDLRIIFILKGMVEELEPPKKAKAKETA